MKFGVIFLALLFGIASAQANDVSCQVDMLTPKINAAIIEEEADKPAKMTVAEARLRLQKNPEEEERETAQTENKNIPAEAAKKESRLGGLFDILLPSKLRNPAK